VSWRPIIAELRWLNPAARWGLGLLLILACVAGGFSWQVEPFRTVERQLYDLRVSLFPETADPDERIALIVFTDETIAATGKQSPVDRDLLGKALAAIDAMGPRSISLDMLFDLKQPEDSALLTVIRSMRTPLYLPGPMGEWAQSYPGGHENARAFLRDSGVPPEHMVSLTLATDDDGTIRNWPSPADSDQPILARALSEGALNDYQGPIRFRLPKSDDGPVIPTYPIELFGGDAEIAELLAPSIAGRHILVGIDSVGIDRFQTPLIYSADEYRDGQLSGIEVQAQMLAQALDGQRYWKPPVWFPPLLPLAILPLAMLTAALAMPGWLRLALSAAQIGFLVLMPFALEYLFEDSADVSAFGWLLCWGLGYFAVVIIRRAKAWEKGRIAQSALTRYLPPDVAAQILNDPSRLALDGQRCKVFALFSDLEGFTTLCQSEQPTDVAVFLNDYLETLSQIVLNHGGTIDKFVGDSVVAFWGAPFAREGDGERAAQAAVAMYEAGETFRTRMLPGGGTVGRTRIGLHYGEAIVGNFGGDGRIQYTALGDTMNLASRLEAANKTLGTSILISREAATFSSGIVLRTMGQITVRGRSAPVMVLEPGLTLSPVDVERMNSLHERASAGDSAALDELRQWAGDRDFDVGLARLVERLSDQPDATARPA
jgi:adenylate cyclase